jgi:sigma-E factor negative regulatory protein RseA
MTQEISSLMDGELSRDEADGAIRACCGNPENEERWFLYHVIGDAIRGDGARSLARDTSIRKSLESEPAIIARPKRVHETFVGRVALAAAASVATIGVVGWIGTQGGQSPSGPVIAKNPSAIQPVATKVPATPAPDMQDYFAAHKQLPSADQYRPVHRTAPAAAAR